MTLDSLSWTLDFGLLLLPGGNPEAQAGVTRVFQTATVPSTPTPPILQVRATQNGFTALYQ